MLQVVKTSHTLSANDFIKGKGKLPTGL